MYGQVTLTFRYGREDEEVMGLKFCNEAVMCLAQLYPPYAGADYHENTSPLQVGAHKDRNSEIATPDIFSGDHRLNRRKNKFADQPATCVHDNFSTI